MQMKRAVGWGGAMIMGLLGVAPGAQAQVAWDSPMLLAPGSPGGWGIHLMEPSPGDGIGVMGTFRSNPAPVGYGFRIGLAEDPGDDLAVFGGLDASGHLLLPTAERPFGVLWLLGAGVGVGDDVVLSLPAGISVGADIDADGVLFRPYVSPRVVLDAAFGTADDLDLDLAVDLGVDLAFTPAWSIRFGATLGDREALSIGLNLPR
ncbi:MAG: hypothetical protein KY453_05820 [Gemmatimonadetes bacterium]|nr:hypothetical protein [Gemmatimonadota bacterium]